jgi:hypothetical protein
MVMISAVCVALIVGPGQAFADPCPTSTEPTTAIETTPSTATPTSPIDTTSSVGTTPPIVEPPPPTTEPPLVNSAILIPPHFPTPATTAPQVALHAYCESYTPSVTPSAVPSTPEVTAPPTVAPTEIPAPAPIPPAYAPTTTPGNHDPPPPTNNAWIPLVVLCALAVAAGLAARAWRHRGGKFLKAHVTVASHRGVPVPFDVRHADGTGRDHILSVVPSVKSHSTTVEEVH